MPTRLVIDREAYLERVALMTEDGTDETWAAQQASLTASHTPFARVATALANGDDGPAKEMCRRELQRHGREHALQLWAAIHEAVAGSLT